MAKNSNKHQLIKVSTSAVTILKVDFEVATLARIEIKIEWTILCNQTINFRASVVIKNHWH